MTDRINVRELAVDVLLAVTRDGEFSHVAERAVLDKYHYLPRQERAFFLRLFEGTLERMIELDYIIDQFSRTKVKKMKPVIAAILRSGVYQLKYMDAVPVSAACNEAVKLARKRGFSGLSGFVNGVMRSVARNMDAISFPDEKKDWYLAMSVRYSMPEWLVRRFAAQYGKERSVHILKAFLEKRPVSALVNTGKISVEDLIESLRKQGIDAVKNDRVSGGIFISGYEALDEIPEFAKGLFYVQDTASMLAVELADPKAGDFVLDACAAPGGKSICAAWKMAGQGAVEARDLTQKKVDLIRENIQRCKVSNLRAVVWDALEFDASAENRADVVIADLPCSGLGVIAGKTDIKYNASEEKIRELAQLQRRMLEVLCRYVKPGGTLLYSTCTMTTEENQKNVASFLAGHPEFVLDVQRQLLPDEGCDGFFMAKLRRLSQDSTSGRKEQ